MLTDNYIESWHNQLKTVFLKRARNKRLDKLIFVLVNDVEYYLNEELERISQGDGAMSSFAKQQRLREKEAEEIKDEERNEMVIMSTDVRSNGNRIYGARSFVDGATTGYLLEVTEEDQIA